MKIRGQELEINILEELEQFDWERQVIKGVKFQACSPFRHETNPSFAVNLENGTWVDSGSTDEYHHAGNFIKLLALIRNVDYSVIEEYLIDKYSMILAETDNLTMDIQLTLYPAPKKYIDRSSLQDFYKVQSDYLTNRGISSEVQRLFEVGYDSNTKSIALVWTDKQGRIINVKYRRTDTKQFYYEKEGQQIRYYVYGLYQCVRASAERIYICESEIDALTLWTYGIPAVALGGSSISDRQKELILSTSIKEVVIATDNDSVGNRIREVLKEEFLPYVRVLDFLFPEGVKDVNEMTKKQVLQSASNLVKLTLPSFYISNNG